MLKSLAHIFVLCFLMQSAPLAAQEVPVDSLNKAKLSVVVVSESVLYSGMMVGLYHTWYKQHELGAFHFFDDNNQWAGMDKLGHSAVGYYVGKAGYESLKWAGVSEKRSVWYGGTLGLVYLTSFEALDGVSMGWGASVGDLVANTAGSALFISQQLAWKEQVVLLKYSYRKSELAWLRQGVFGSSLPERLIKDYNGQTYWLSANLKKITGVQQLPGWLNVAVGYAGRGMYYGDPDQVSPEGLNLKREVKWSLSLDVDLNRIKSKSKLINVMLGAFGFVKFPFPALTYSTATGVGGDWFGF